MKLLITGIHGFVGGDLVKALAKDHEIYGLDIIAPEKEGVVKTYSWDDLENPRQAQGPLGCRRWMQSSIWLVRRMIRNPSARSGTKRLRCISK